MSERIFIFKSADGRIFKEKACLEETARKNLKWAINSVDVNDFVLVGTETKKPEIITDNTDSNMDLDYD